MMSLCILCNHLLLRWKLQSPNEGSDSWLRNVAMGGVGTRKAKNTEGSWRRASFIWQPRHVWSIRNAREQAVNGLVDSWQSFHDWSDCLWLRCHGIEDSNPPSKHISTFFFGCTLNHLTTEQWSWRRESLPSLPSLWKELRRRKMKFNGFVMSGWAVKGNSRMSGCDMLMAGFDTWPDIP